MLRFPVDEPLDMAPYTTDVVGCKSALGGGAVPDARALSAGGAAAGTAPGAVKGAQLGRYRLHCVIEHVGTNMHHGHYVAYVRKGARWLRCNDEKIFEVRTLSSSQLQAALELMLRALFRLVPSYDGVWDRPVTRVRA